MTATQAVSAQQLLENPDFRSCELVRGEPIVMTPASARHGKIAARITVRLGSHVETAGLGAVYTAETGFHIASNPDTVRSPDVAFVRNARAKRASESGFFQGPPDLAVEVLSPNDTASEINDKIQQWLEAGCEQVWVIDPRTRTVTVYERTGQIRMLKSADRLAGGELLPGFELRVEDIFAQ